MEIAGIFVRFLFLFILFEVNLELLQLILEAIVGINDWPFASDIGESVEESHAFTSD